MKNLIKKISKPILGILIGFCIAFLILESLLNLIGFYQKRIFDLPNNTKQNIILTLGDSMTAVGGNDTYSSQLQKILDRKNIEYRVINGGISGASTYVILNDLEKNIAKYHPKIIVLMAGINDYGVK